MFINQQGIYPFPKITPIKLPGVIEKITNYIKNDASRYNIIDDKELLELEIQFREWFNPLIDLSSHPFVYFLNNGITQGLETIGLLYKDQNIKFLEGDYFWLKVIGAGSEEKEKINCTISYSTSPSSINGNISNDYWPSDIHILDGAYIGTSELKTVVPDNTEIIFLGFSKNLGLPELRSGLMFSKNPILHLEMLQKKFKYIGLNYFRSIAKICNEISITDLSRLLKNYQKNYCDLYKEFIPSDSALIATTDNQDYKFYKRKNGIIRIPLGESISYCILNKII